MLEKTNFASASSLVNKNVLRRRLIHYLSVRLPPLEYGAAETKTRVDELVTRPKAATARALPTALPSRFLFFFASPDVSQQKSCCVSQLVSLFPVYQYAKSHLLISVQTSVGAPVPLPLDPRLDPTLAARKGSAHSIHRGCATDYGGSFASDSNCRYNGIPHDALWPSGLMLGSEQR